MFDREKCSLQHIFVQNYKWGLALLPAGLAIVILYFFLYLGDEPAVNEGQLYPAKDVTTVTAII